MSKVLVAFSFTLCTSFASGQLASASSADPISPVPDSCAQLLLVHAPSWSSPTAVLERYERRDRHWAPVGAAIPVNLGRSGLGWGRGLQDPGGAGPIKREGDGRSPAGVFRLGTAFGAAEREPSESHSYPYMRTLATTYCVEDVHSAFYNQIIDASAVTRTVWQQWSEMRRSDGLFNWGVVVRQNDPEPVKGAGSCVFLHIWRGPRMPTAGCTSMAPDRIEQILSWLEPSSNPVLVQLPDPVLHAVRSDWGLP